MLLAQLQIGHRSDGVEDEMQKLTRLHRDSDGAWIRDDLDARNGHVLSNARAGGLATREITSGETDDPARFPYTR